MENKPCKWLVFSMNIYSDEGLAQWLQELGFKYSFYQVKLYEDKSVRVICQDWK